MYLVNAAQMRRFEQAADAAGLSYAEMMRRAGTAVADLVHEHYPMARVAVLAGPGNNGGDALVAASLLAQRGHAVAVCCCGRKLASDPLVGPLKQLSVLIRLVEDTSQLANWRELLMEAEVAIDGLLGTGARRPIEGIFAALLGELADIQARQRLVVVAVDVPSGLDCDAGEIDAATVRADLTVTFGFPKIGQLSLPGADYVGQLVVDEIGIQASEQIPLTVTTAAEAAGWLPARPRGAHKGTFGRGLVVGGSTPYTGAAYLAAAAAYRAGCGLVTAALPESLHPVVATLLPEATFLLLPEDLGVIARPAADLVARAAGSYEALDIGPGLTTERPAAEFLTQLIDRLSGTAPSGVGFNLPFAAAAPKATATSGEPGSSATPPAEHAQPAADHRAAAQERPNSWVVDADGLNLVAQTPALLSRLPRPCVLTPHPGEMARLLSCSSEEVNADRLSVARRAAAEWGHVVVLKGAFTVVAAPDGRLAVNPFAEPALARAGTGDVLAGLVLGLLAQGVNQFDAARLAAYVHGLAGERAADKVGRRSTTAVDVLAQVPGALGELESRARETGPRVVLLRGR